MDLTSACLGLGTLLLSEEDEDFASMCGLHEAGTVLLGCGAALSHYEAGLTFVRAEAALPHPVQRLVKEVKGTLAIFDLWLHESKG